MHHQIESKNEVLVHQDGQYREQPSSDLFISLARRGFSFPPLPILFLLHNPPSPRAPHFSVIFSSTQHAFGVGFCLCENPANPVSRARTCSTFLGAQDFFKGLY